MILLGSGIAGPQTAGSRAVPERLPSLPVRVMVVTLFNCAESVIDTSDGHDIADLRRALVLEECPRTRSPQRIRLIRRRRAPASAWSPAGSPDPWSDRATGVISGGRPTSESRCREPQPDTAIPQAISNAIVRHDQPPRAEVMPLRAGRDRQTCPAPRAPRRARSTSASTTACETRYAPGCGRRPRPTPAPCPGRSTTKPGLQLQPHCSAAADLRRLHQVSTSRTAAWLHLRFELHADHHARERAATSVARDVTRTRAMPDIVRPDDSARQQPSDGDGHIR